MILCSSPQTWKVFMFHKLMYLWPGQCRGSSVFVYRTREQPRWDIKHIKPRNCYDSKISKLLFIDPKFNIVYIVDKNLP